MRVLFALLLSSAAFAGDWFLFTSFRRNGETGVYFALSQDGRTWTPGRGNQPWIKPEQRGMLMRDPFLAKGPDGVWHMLWTWGWNRKETGGRLKIGHASSRDLVTWSKQEEIPVMQDEPLARNAWAPEAVWDPRHKEWIICWATTIAPQGARNDHRLYATTTRDWKQFTPSKLWFDPGFNSIDSTVIRDGKRWIMVFKDEREQPLMKRLRLAFADSPAGPWRDVTEPFTHDWVEGPSAIKIGPEWWIYFDNYRKPQHYGAVRTRDWKSFEDVTAQVKFPEDHRHGTVVRITEREAKRLR